MKFCKYLLFTIVLPFLWLSSIKENDSHLNEVTPFSFSDDSLEVNIARYFDGTYYSINDTLDLNGKTWILPPDIRIKVINGMIKNGIIVGNNTRLDYQGVVFDSIYVKGTWIIPVIKSTMFANLSYDNSLKDLFALSNPKTRNEIYIDDGIYYLSAQQESDQCITINSNSFVTLDGEIRLRPNAFKGYKMLFTRGNNIAIQGKGSIVGDKDNHLGNDGEWGMGIYVSGGQNICISELIVKNCWGDCIYVTRKANKVSIDGCYLGNSRRQGISIISADSVFVKNCQIKNIGGTPPGYAIDVEPNKGDSVKYVLIDGVKVQDCVGGFSGYRSAKDTDINTIEIRNCTIAQTETYPLAFVKTKTALVQGCDIKQYKSEKAIYCDDVFSIHIVHNAINGKKLKNNRRGRSQINQKNVNILDLN